MGCDHRSYILQHYGLPPILGSDVRWSEHERSLLQRSGIWVNCIRIPPTASTYSSRNVVSKQSEIVSDLHVIYIVVRINPRVAGQFAHLRESSYA